MKRRTRQKCYAVQTCFNLVLRSICSKYFSLQYFSSYIRDAHKCMQARPSHELSVTAVRLLPILGRLEAF